MQESIERTLNEFIESLRNTREYSEYEKSLQEIVSREDYKNFVIDLKRDQLRIGEKAFEEGDISDEFAADMERKLKTVMEHRALSRFMKAETDFSTMLSEVMAELSIRLHSWFLDSTMDRDNIN